MWFKETCQQHVNILSRLAPQTKQARAAHHVTPVAEENKKYLEFGSTKTNKDNNNKIIENHHTA
jgi:hypothetical protein